MKTEGVVVGSGGLKPWAKRVAQRFEKLNGIPVHLIDEKFLRRHVCKKPHWGKAFAWHAVTPDVERVVILDADLIPIRPLPELPTEPFSAMCAQMRPGFIQTRFPLFHPELESWYFSSGLMIATRESVRAFDLVKAFMRATRGRLIPMVDQSWFNLAVRIALRDYHPLPQQWNWRTSRYGPEVKPDTLMIHCVRRKAEAMKRIWAEIDEGRYDGDNDSR